MFVKLGYFVRLSYVFEDCCPFVMRKVRDELRKRESKGIRWGTNNEGGKWESEFQEHDCNNEDI